MKLETSTKEQSTDFSPVHIPEGIYTAELKEVKDVSDGQYGARVAFVYDITEQGVELALIAYKSRATRDNKIGQTLMAHGLEINNEEADTDKIIGSMVRAWVDDYTQEFELNGTKKQQIKSIISKVKAMTTIVEEKTESVPLP